MRALNLSERLLTPAEEAAYSESIQLGRAASERLESESDTLAAPERLALKREKRRGEKSFNEFVEVNLRLVADRATKLGARSNLKEMSYSYDDLFQEGTLGLMRGIEKFDPAKGFKLSTYAVNWIDQYIGRFIFSNESVIKIPPQINSELKSAIAKLENDPDSFDENFAESIEANSNYKVYRALRAHKPLSLDSSINSSSDSDDGSENRGLSKLARDLASPDTADGEVITNDLSEQLQVVMAKTLSAREMIVVNRRFGLAGVGDLDDGPTVSLRQIGEELSITGEAARKTMKSAYAKLLEDPDFNNIVEMMNSNA